MTLEAKIPPLTPTPCKCFLSLKFPSLGSVPPSPWALPSLMWQVENMQIRSPFTLFLFKEASPPHFGYNSSCASLSAAFVSIFLSFWAIVIFIHLVLWIKFFGGNLVPLLLYGDFIPFSINSHVWGVQNRKIIFFGEICGIFSIDFVSFHFCS